MYYSLVSYSPSLLSTVLFTSIFSPLSYSLVSYSPLSTVLFPSILSLLSYSLVSSPHCLVPTLPIFTDFYRIFGLSCRCITRCAIHQLVCQVYYSPVSLPPFPSPPLLLVIFLDFSVFCRFLPIFTDLLVVLVVQ